MKNEYFSIPQLAKMLGMSRIAIYKKVKKGKIKAIKIGRSFAIPKESVKKYFIDVKGTPLGKKEKEKIEKAVKRTIDEYGDVLKWLGNER